MIIVYVKLLGIKINVKCNLCFIFRELKTRFGKNRYLGYIWVVGEPMSIVLLVTIIGTIVREYHHQVMPEGISIFMFLISGIMPFYV